MKRLIKSLFILLIIQLFVYIPVLGSDINGEKKIIRVEAKDFEKYGITIKEVSPVAERFDNTYIVKLKDPNSNAIQSVKGKIKKKSKKGDIIQVELSQEGHAVLKKHADIQYIEPNFKIESLEQTVPYGIQNIKAIDVQNTGISGKGIKVAVIDTGVGENEDIKVAGGKSFVEGVASYSDDNGHGTHVAGIIAAISNQIGVVGAAPEVNIYSLKVLDSNGIGSYSALIDAIDWAIENDMDIINMSLGGTAYSAILEEKLQEAYDSGILLVASAGNGGSGKDTILYPAKYSSVMAVGAVDQKNQRASFSSEGFELEIMAPGVDILSTLPNNQFGIKSGTSMAAPHVTGVAALVLDKKRNLTVDELRGLLNYSADEIGVREEYGNGLLNAQNTIEQLKNFEKLKKGDKIPKKKLKSKYESINHVPEEAPLSANAIQSQPYYLNEGYGDQVPHNYYYAYQIFAPKGSSKMRVYMLVDTEPGYDFVRTDACTCDKWSGTQYVWSSWKGSDSMFIILETDSSIYSRGFQTYSIEYETTSNPPSANVYYLSPAVENSRDANGYYFNNMNETKRVTVPNASRIAVVFEKIDTEAGYDYVRTSTGNQYDGFRTEVLSNWSNIGTNYIDVTLQTDYSVVKWGYKIARVFYEASGGGGGTHTWYSQITPSAGVGWNPTYLNNTYYINAGTPTNHLLKHIEEWGCFVASWAMVLKNMGKKSSSVRYDFRTNTNGYLDPDPFTVTLANTLWYPITYNSTTGRYESAYSSRNSPVNLDYTNVQNGFGVTMKEISLLGKSDEEKARILTYWLQKNPEGIIVRISLYANPTKREDGFHTLVFTKSSYPYASPADTDWSQLENKMTPEEMLASDLESIRKAGELDLNSETRIQATSPLDGYFTVTDPGTGRADKGNNVPFNQSYSWNKYGGLQHLVYLQYLD